MILTNRGATCTAYRKTTSSSLGFEDPLWVDNEVSKCHFKDVRLGRRFQQLLEQIGESVGGSIPFACQDWANTKAAYRFLSNPRVSEAEILAGHFESTISHRATASGVREKKV